MASTGVLVGQEWTGGFRESNMEGDTLPRGSGFSDIASETFSAFWW
jgi:hypothetical protein